MNHEKSVNEFFWLRRYAIVAGRRWTCGYRMGKPMIWLLTDNQNQLLLISVVFNRAREKKETNGGKKLPKPRNGEPSVVSTTLLWLLLFSTNVRNFFLSLTLSVLATSSPGIFQCFVFPVPPKGNFLYTQPPEWCALQVNTLCTSLFLIYETDFDGVGFQSRQLSTRFTPVRS